MPSNILVDFNNIGVMGVRLSTIVTVYDLARQRIRLVEGLPLRVYDEELEAAGKVGFSTEDFAWVLIPEEKVFRQTQLVYPELPELLAALKHEYFDQQSDVESPECPRVWCAGDLSQPVQQVLDSAGTYIDITRRHRVATEGALIFLHNNHVEVKARLSRASDGFKWQAVKIGPIQPFKGRPFMIADIDMEWRQPFPH